LVKYKEASGYVFESCFDVSYKSLVLYTDEKARFFTEKILKNINNSKNHGAKFDSSMAIGAIFDLNGSIIDVLGENGSEIYEFNSRDSVICDWYKNDHFHVSYQGVIGWIPAYKLKDEFLTSALFADLMKKCDTVSGLKRMKTLTSRYGSTTAKRIIEGKIWMGMTKEMTRESRGDPEDINRTVGSWGVHEQWLYNGTYLYFENGKLTSWQD
jgi:hypothetical protein